MLPPITTPAGASSIAATLHTGNNATATNTVVASASQEPVIAAGARLGISQRQFPFLPVNSQIINGNAVNFVSAIFPQSGITHSITSSDFDELANYLVLSTCVHALDGWRYLSQAATSLLNGSRNEAIHLSYYAELRAALSILAGFGIGVLKNQHFSLSEPSAIHFFRGRTHDIAWACLSQWAGVSGNASAVTESLSIFNINADEWADAYGITAGKAAVAEYWLQNWCFDLSGLSGDSAIRNEASYRPNLSFDAYSKIKLEELEFIKCAADSCRPLGGGEFDSVDLMLIHELGQQACQLQFSSVDYLAQKRVWLNVHQWLVNTKGLRPEEAAATISDLRSAPTTSANTILDKARTSNQTVTGVFSRALLLLRLATGLLRRQWRLILHRASSRVTRYGLMAWQEHLLDAYSHQAQIWGGTSRPNNYDILDADREQAQEVLDLWLRKQTKFNAVSMWKNIPAAHALQELCRFEKIALMGTSL